MTADTGLNEEDKRRKLRVLRREIQKGLRDVERGRVVSGPRAFAEVRKMLREAPRPAGRLPSMRSGYSSHRLLEARSLAMHTVIAAKIEHNPKLLDVPRKNLKRWRAGVAGRAPTWLEEWSRIMRRPWPQIAAVITEPSEEGARLRQS